LTADQSTHRAPALSAALLVRCALHAGPLSVAIAAAGPLGGVAWQVPTGTLLLGWSAAQALAGVGTIVARRAGPGAGARVVGLGFVAAAALWCTLVLLAPPDLVGAERARAAAIGVCGLAALGTVTAALVTRSEAAVVRWSLPCWLLAAVGIAGAIGDTWVDRIPITLLLPLAIAAAATRAFRPALGRTATFVPRADDLRGVAGRLVPGKTATFVLRADDLRGVAGRLVPGKTATFVLRADDLRGVAGRLVLGAGQAACAALLWHAGPPAATSPAVLPLVATVPVVEALIAWHRRQVSAGLDLAESAEEFRAHVGDVTVVTVAALLPPLAAGAALALAAYRLPGGGAREGVLVFAGGILLSGVLALTLLLAARDRTAVAAALAVAPPLAAAATPLVPVLPPDPLPTVVAILAATHLVGLLTVAHTAADPRRTP